MISLIWLKPTSTFPRAIAAKRSERCLNAIVFGFISSAMPNRSNTPSM
jgi:hypothetical protein